MISKSPKTVSLIHGFAAFPGVLIPLQRRLAAKGLSAEIFSYPSINLSLVDVSHLFAERLNQQKPDAIVAHSMGCVATLLAVQLAIWSGPIVMLAPPLKGIPSVRWIPRLVHQWIVPLTELNGMPGSLNDHIKIPVDCPLRVIAGLFDLSVPIASTRHEAVCDHRVVCCTHNGLLISRKAADLAAEWIVQRTEV